MHMVEMSLGEYSDFGSNNEDKVSVPSKVVESGRIGDYLNSIAARDGLDIRCMIAMSSKMKGTKFDNKIINAILSFRHPLIKVLPTLSQDTNPRRIILDMDKVALRNYYGEFLLSHAYFKDHHKLMRNSSYFVYEKTLKLEEAYMETAYKVSFSDDGFYYSGKIKDCKDELRVVRKKFHKSYKNYIQSVEQCQKAASLYLDDEFDFEELNHDEYLTDDNHDYSPEYWSSELSESSGDLPEYKNHSGLMFTDDYISYYGEGHDETEFTAEDEEELVAMYYDQEFTENGYFKIWE